MSGFPSRAAVAAAPIPIGSCVPLTRSTNNPAFLPVGSLIERARYPELSAVYPRAIGVSAATVTVTGGDYRFSATDGKRVVMSNGGSGQPGIYSDDGGSTWGSVTFPAAPYWSSIRHGNGRWVMVRPAASQGAYSLDGLVWSTTSMPSYASWYRLAFGSGWFVSTTYDSDKVARTEDGVTWSTATLPSSGEWAALAFGNGRFVILKNNSTDMAYSDDGGATWTASSLPASGSWGMLSYGNGRFVTVAVDGTKSLMSADGLTWAEGALPASRPWLHPMDTGGGYDLVYSANTNEGAISSDGVNWAAVSLPANGTPARSRSGIFIAGRYVIYAGVNGKIDLVVPDGPGATHMLLGGPAGYHVRVR